jgi:hypothetical protein
VLLARHDSRRRMAIHDRGGRGDVP